MTGYKTMPIRILHVVDTLNTGGLEMGVVKLIQRMDPHRFEHVVCAVRDLGTLSERIASQGVEMMCLNKTVPGLSFQMGAFARRIREVKPHIVHSRNWGTIEAVVAGRWVGSCKVVHSEHGIESDRLLDLRRRRWFRRVAYELADRVFSVSHQLKELLEKRTGFPGRKIEVIHNGVDTQRFCPQPAARVRVRHRLGVAPEEFCIGAVARLEPVKDLLTLLRATAELPGDCKNWRLVVAGAGSEMARLQQFSNNHASLHGRVNFIGEIQDVPEMLNALDCYVLPSLSEGISNSLLEAMATGLPVIASATGGNPEVVVDSESGMLFPVGDFVGLAERLKMLREQSELRIRLGHYAVRRVMEHFSLESMIRKYEGLYDSLAPQKWRVVGATNVTEHCTKSKQATTFNHG
jgi:sugar transferase (PEP-CTERM/EpsH1 system associated)